MLQTCGLHCHSSLATQSAAGKKNRGEGDDGLGLAYLSIRCNPLAVSTMVLISPGLRAKAASSNSFCMSPLPK